MEKYNISLLPCNIPEPLCSFAGVYLPQFSSIFIHGGFGDNENNAIYCINLESLQSMVKASSTLSLIGHAAVEIEGRMFIFGGWNGTEYSNSSLIFDPLDESVKKTEAPSNAKEWEYPVGRRDHSLTLAGNNIYLLGGWDSWKWTNAPSTFSQLWKLTDSWKWELCEVFGENPSTCRGHSTIYFAELEELVVFGGIYGYTTLLNDLHVLNLKDMQWNKLVTNDGPSKRAWHCAANVDKYMYVFGGLIEIKKTSNELFRFDLLEKKWEEIFVENMPSPRCGALMINVEGFLVVLGGKNQQEETLKDAFVIDIDQKYENYRENADNYGVCFKEIGHGIEPPQIPKEHVYSKRYIPKTNFDVNKFPQNSRQHFNSL
ncbi:hypothetical protein SteCoe_5127 [Stentor coeruleus]|uniref:Uncharacterized protein n=1 Tax=Stentor coeruleus TaxID=5963 RepID=A0A1R2CSZ3_9CILI|nr:hypothetical protein SteCoe_5127 [Stentor coeruleus]